ncbi:Lipase, class 3 family-containing protein [Strongyloides ratti]|uniref:Lipase, class 3 family-containing protein n=1 Tax=Strongyloides ratti TaxID=34506 RepID=A0A090LIZ4_STRRB|nr:Lipase, class 3 family-containing protein [Strongyloides ratti]CEF69683.1 Lipase, class 3 family-containing protein [Strongyloides ratti]
MYFFKNVLLLILYSIICYSQTSNKKLSAGAYSNDPTSCINEAFKDNGVYEIFNNETAICDKGNNVCTYYSVISNENKEITIVFRGTKTTDQLIREGIATLIDGKDFFNIGLVNRYFFQAHNVLWNSINEIFQDNKYKDYKVYVTGHSLGGALAALCAIRIQLENIRNSSDIFLYTFGEPRVGSASFAFKFDELIPNSWRIVHALDVVPHLPPCGKEAESSLLKKFFGKSSQPCDPTLLDEPYHHGTEIWYPNGMGEGDTFVECTGTPKNEDFECSDQYKFDIAKFKVYAEDHRHYFNHKVPAFGKLGCLPGMENEEENLPDDAV